MGQFRKSKDQKQKELLEMFRKRIEGASWYTIQKEYNLTHDNLFHTYVPAINKMWRDIWIKKDENEIWAEAQALEERLTVIMNMSLVKAQEHGARSGWGTVAMDAAINLFKFKSDGITAVNKIKVSQIEERTRKLMGPVSKPGGIEGAGPEREDEILRPDQEDRETEPVEDDEEPTNEGSNT